MNSKCETEKFSLSVSALGPVGIMRISVTKKSLNQVFLSRPNRNEPFKKTLAAEKNKFSVILRNLKFDKILAAAN